MIGGGLITASLLDTSIFCASNTLLISSGLLNVPSGLRTSEKSNPINKKISRRNVWSFFYRREILTLRFRDMAGRGPTCKRQAEGVGNVPALQLWSWLRGLSRESVSILMHVRECIFLLVARASAGIFAAEWLHPIPPRQRSVPLGVFRLSAFQTLNPKP